MVKIMLRKESPMSNRTNESQRIEALRQFKNKQWTWKRFHRFRAELRVPFPPKAQMFVRRQDGISTQCFQTYANRMFVDTLVSNSIRTVYYGLGFNTILPRLTALGYPTEFFSINGVRYLKIFPKKENKSRDEKK